MADESEIDVFLSHSSRDAELAKALVELLRSALNIASTRIRCTSVSGYKLRVGADTNEQLRRETVESRVLIGLITEVSVESAYVLFELGARWGAKKFLAPVLGAGRGPEILAGPLSGLNALSCTREDLFQLVANVGAELGIVAESPDVYAERLDAVVGVSSQLAEQRGLDAAAAGTAGGNSEEARTVSLSDFQCEYIMTISRPRNEGFIYGGVDEHKGREVAAYQEALELFQAVDLMTYSSGGYRLTQKGWKLADQLWKLKIVDVLSDDALKKEDEIGKDVELTDGEAEAKELTRLLGELENDGLVVLSKTRGGSLARLSTEGLTFRKHRPLSV